MTQYRTVQLPPNVHSDMNSLKIRLAGDSGKIPSNGDVIRAVIRVANAHYPELLTVLADTSNTEDSE